MSKHTWRIFALLNGIGTFLFTFGTIDGHPVTAAFLPVGMLLLVPGTFVAMPVGQVFGRLVDDDTFASFLAACVAVAVNLGIWLLAARLVHLRRLRTNK